MKESAAALKRRAHRIVEGLTGLYPDARTALAHEDPLQLLIATILSAQCTDERVNKVTPGLFARYRTAAQFAAADRDELESIIRSTGFYRAKAKSILGCCRAIVERHGGIVPASMDALVALPGVGRKTANVVLGSAFGIVSGVVVDTHVKRLSGRFRLSRHEDPEKIEKDLMKIFPKERWIELSHAMILHGRAVCKARTPQCARCGVKRWCPSDSSAAG